MLPNHSHLAHNHSTRPPGPPSGNEAPDPNGRGPVVLHLRRSLGSRRRKRRHKSKDWLAVLTKHHGRNMVRYNHSANVTLNGKLSNNILVTLPSCSPNSANVTFMWRSQCRNAINLPFYGWFLPPISGNIGNEHEVYPQMAMLNEKMTIKHRIWG